jgi:hypothetical protein
MKRSAQALMALAVTAVVFALCLWLAWTFRFPWEPRVISDRWGVAGAFASLIAGSLFILLNSRSNAESKHHGAPIAADSPGAVGASLSDSIGSFPCKRCGKKQFTVHPSSRGSLILVCGNCFLTMRVVHDGERWLKLVVGGLVVAEGATAIADYFDITPHDLAEIIATILGGVIT